MSFLEVSIPGGHELALPALHPAESLTREANPWALLERKKLSGQAPFPPKAIFERDALSWYEIISNNNMMLLLKIVALASASISEKERGKM